MITVQAPPEVQQDASPAPDVAELPPAQRLARAVLLFLPPHAWTHEDFAVWHAATGQRRVSMTALLELARKVEHEG